MPEKLKEYISKRDFKKTGEPDGTMGVGKRQANEEDALRFVVQHHIASRDHNDFRLEWRGALLSWAVPKGPSFDPADKRLAVRVEDHPLDYRNFEGTIPRGQYGGGTVMLWDEGFWLPLGDAGEGMEKGSFKFYLIGIRLKGKWALVKLPEDEKRKGDNWLLCKERDEYALKGAGIGDYAVSVRSGLTMEEIGRNKL